MTPAIPQDIYHGETQMNVNIKDLPGATKHEFTFNGMPVTIKAGFAESGTLFLDGKIGELRVKGFQNAGGANLVESDALGSKDTPGFMAKVRELVGKPAAIPMPSAASKTKKPAKKEPAPKTKEEKAAERVAKKGRNDAMFAKKEPEATPAPAPAKPAKSTAKALRDTTAKKPAAPKADKGPKKPSMLDAAATILGKAKEPMCTKAIYDAMVSQGLWTSAAGKTPQNTLHAAISREIKEKGKDSRFAKKDKGFAAA